MSESSVLAQVRLEAAQAGWHLWRNNVGVLVDRTGRPVRYGLANDGKALNQRLKSADLIGWKPYVVTAADVGRTLAVFVSREVKDPDGYTDKDRLAAQMRWHALVIAAGGDSAIVTGVGSIK